MFLEDIYKDIFLFQYVYLCFKGIIPTKVKTIHPCFSLISLFILLISLFSLKRFLLWNFIKIYFYVCSILYIQKQTWGTKEWKIALFCIKFDKFKFSRKIFSIVRCISSRLKLKINNVCKASLFLPQYHHFSFDFFTRLASITPACK